MEGVRPPNLPCFFKAIHACTENKHQLVACGLSCFQMHGGCAPPTSRFFEASHADCKNKVIAMLPPQPPAVLEAIYTWNKSILSSPCLHQGTAVRIIFLRMGGAAPPQPPCFLRPSMLARSDTYRVITMFAVGEGCSGHFVCAIQLRK